MTTQHRIRVSPLRRLLITAAISAFGLPFLARAPTSFASALNAVANEDSLHHQESSTAPIALIYPELPEPLASALAQICNAIEETVPTKRFPLKVSADVSEAALQVRRANVGAAIALGRKGASVGALLERDMPVVLGALLYGPESGLRGTAGISLFPDPSLLLERLRTIAPSIKRIIAVYSSKESEWILRLARDAARPMGVEIEAVESQSLAGTVRFYQSFFANPSTDKRRDAIWILPDRNAVDDQIVLPLVLKEAWDRKIVVLSSVESHVKRGALLGVAPNNRALGKSLAATARALESGDFRRKGTVIPLHDVYMVLNRRTGKHLELAIPPSMERQFDLVFPEN